MALFLYYALRVMTFSDQQMSGQPHSENQWNKEKQSEVFGIFKLRLYHDFTGLGRLGIDFFSMWPRDLKWVWHPFSNYSNVMIGAQVPGSVRGPDQKCNLKGARLELASLCWSTSLDKWSCCVRKAKWRKDNEVNMDEFAVVIPEWKFS